MDVVLLVDIDQNILPEDFIKVKEFLVNLINRYEKFPSLWFSFDTVISPHNVSCFLFVFIALL